MTVGTTFPRYTNSDGKGPYEVFSYFFLLCSLPLPFAYYSSSVFILSLLPYSSSLPSRLTPSVLLFSSCFSFFLSLNLTSSSPPPFFTAKTLHLHSLAAPIYFPSFYCQMSQKTNGFFPSKTRLFFIQLFDFSFAIQHFTFPVFFFSLVFSALFFFLFLRTFYLQILWSHSFADLRSTIHNNIHLSVKNLPVDWSVRRSVGWSCKYFCSEFCYFEATRDFLLSLSYNPSVPWMRSMNRH